LNLFNLNDIVFEEVDHLFGSLKCMLLRIALKAFKSLNKMLLLVVGKSLDNVDHENSIAAVILISTQIEPFVLRVVDNLWLSSSINIVVQKDAFFEEHIHLVVLRVVTRASARLLEDVELVHCLEVCHIDLMDLNWVLRLLFWQKIAITVLKLVDQDLVGCHVDSTKHAIV